MGKGKLEIKSWEWNRNSLMDSHWCGPSALSISFPSLFGIAANKYVTVADVWDSTVGLGSWNPSFVRVFND